MDNDDIVAEGVKVCGLWFMACRLTLNVETRHALSLHLTPPALQDIFP